MNLFQFLRFVRIGTPIIIYDIEDVEICKVTSKEYLNIDLFEYEILSVSTKKDSEGISYLTIDLEK